MKWKILKKPANKSKIKKDEIVDLLLENRGLVSSKEKDKFLNPKHPKLIELGDVGIRKLEVKKAIRRISEALSGKQKTIIYGDYDCDGICATAIIWETLFGLGMDVSPHIPDRFTEGYGLNVKSVEKLKEEYPELKLIITVDNGIVAGGEVAKINKLGIDVIITDHHEMGRRKLPSVACVHTTQIGGAGVSWMFSRQIAKELGGAGSVSEVDAKLELAALGTIADQLPLMDANRSIVKTGLEQLANTKRQGLFALLKQAGADKYKIDAGTVNFVIAPRINAMGRLAQGMESLRLLCTKDAKRASQLALLLNKTNTKRQVMVEEAILMAQKMADEKKWRGIIVLAHESFHEGIIGLIASRLVEKFNRPAIVLSKGKKTSKASARSVDGFNIIKAIRGVEELLDAVGGHKMAAGFSIPSKNIDEFTKKLNQMSEGFLSEGLLTKKMQIETEVSFPILNLELVKKISKLEPFGQGNPEPIFATRQVKIAKISSVGKDASHLKLLIEKESKYIDAIGFRFGEYVEKINIGDFVDIAFVLEENAWNGQTSLQLRIKDIREEVGNKK